MSLLAATRPGTARRRFRVLGIDPAVAGATGYGAADKKSGQANGQGLFQLWYVVSPKGTPVRH